MKLVTYQVEQKIRAGLISEDGEWVFPLESAGLEYKTMLEAVKQISESEIQLLEYISKKEPYSIPVSYTHLDVYKRQVWGVCAPWE